MFDWISHHKEFKIKGSIQRPFRSPLPAPSKKYPHDAPAASVPPGSFLYSLLIEFLTFFSVVLNFNAPTTFRELRRSWGIVEQSYQDAFLAPLVTLSGPLGFSGATFFNTANGEYLIKSIDRTFEWRYYYTHLLVPLSAYYLENPNTYIVHITDVLFNFAPRLARLFKTSPSNYLVMVNSAQGEGWEEYDLKPTSYFYPERDFLGGRWTSEKTKEMLHDEFPGEIKLTREVYDRVMSQLEKDSVFLCSMEAIDYSLFLLRRKCGEVATPGTVRDASREWEYRFTILDFFTSTKMVRTKLMKVGIGMLGHGDMTITAPVRPSHSAS